MIAQQFEGKVVLVTGGASGIGEACALTFARGGAKMLIADLIAFLCSEQASCITGGYDVVDGDYTAQ
jgi:NAD(P)-dependent dehydrogenase (short-subunit alcohol dehydrogenase family)